MKNVVALALPLVLLGTLSAQSSAPSGPDAPPLSSDKLKSGVFDYASLPATKTALGERRALFDHPTDTLAKLHGHITTLNPGQRSSEPRKHIQEEIIIVKDGVVEANWDGQSKTAGPGSVIFFAAGATTFLRNTSQAPTTYLVLNYFPTLPATR